MTLSPLRDCPFEAPFTPADVAARGLSRAALRGWLERGECRRLARGLYAPRHLAESEALRSIWSTRAVVTGEFAVSAVGSARLHDIPIPRRPHPSTLRPIPLRNLPQDCRSSVGQFVVPSPEWTCVLLARGQSLSGALIVFDAAARARLDPEHLAELYSRTTRWPGIAHIGTAINEMDAASGSPLESASRGWMIERGLPRPALQSPFALDGAKYFVDFHWVRQQVIGEADGLAKYEDRSEIRKERLRQSALDSTGCRVLRWGWDDLEGHPERLLRALRGALRC